MIKRSPSPGTVPGTGCLYKHFFPISAKSYDNPPVFCYNASCACAARKELIPVRKCINFDDKFADFTSAWMKQHEKEYRNFDAMEADMPRVYMSFLNTPARWLDNVTPGAYFTQFEDPKDLVDWLCDYCAQGVPVPDLLLDQITTVGKPCEKRLVALLKDEDIGSEAKMTAIGLLR